MSDPLPPRGGAVNTVHDPVGDFFAQRKDWIALFNRVVRPALAGSLTLSIFVMAMMVGTAFGLAAWRAALAMPVGDMSLGFAPLAVAALPVLVHQVSRSMDKRAGVAG